MAATYIMTKTYNKRLFSDKTADEVPGKKASIERVKTFADKRREFELKCERFNLPVNPVALVFPTACMDPMCLNSSTLEMTSYWVCPRCSAVAPDYVRGHYTRLPESKWDGYPKNKKKLRSSLTGEWRSNQITLTKTEKNARQNISYKRNGFKIVVTDKADRPSPVTAFFSKKKAAAAAAGEEPAAEQEKEPEIINVTLNDTSGECASDRIQADIAALNRTSFMVDLVTRRRHMADDSGEKGADGRHSNPRK